MIRYSINRVLLLIPVIIAVSLIVFALIELAPGTVVDGMISGSMTQEDITLLRARYDLDKPMFFRYGKYMLNLIQGDLGTSQATGISVFDTFIQRLPNTLLLSFTATAIGIAISIPMGVQAARKAGTLADTAATTFTLIGQSAPPFWLGLLMLLLFSLRLGWFPAGGNKDGIRSLILPAICSAMALSATSARQTRSSMLEVLRADFLRTARAKGVPEKTVISKHALGNALIPIITTIGSAVCVQLAGAVVIEQVFAWPGIGRMLIEGVFARDVTVILGCTIMTTILYVLVMLLVDLAYAFVDPRIKSQYMAKKRKRKSAETAPSESATPDTEPIVMEEMSDHNDIVSSAVRSNEDIPIRNAVLLTQADCCNRGSEQNESSDISRSIAFGCVTREYGKNTPIGDTALDVAEIMSRYKKRSRIGEIWHKLLRYKSSIAGLIILGLVFFSAIFSLFMSYDSVTAANVPARFSAPNWQLPFGADNMGRNSFLRVIYGSRYSIVIGFGAVAISTLVGVVLGAASAYYGGMTDNIIMRISDILASIPGPLLGIVIMVVLGTSLQNLIIAVAVGGIPHFIRIARASILTVKDSEYVEAARAVGYSDLRIIATQILPNGLSPIIVQATASLGITIMIAAALSYLGFGVPSPIPEWGALISAGREFIRSAPWLMAFPGIAIMITVLGFNLLGDGLRDALDPKLKK